MGQRGALQGAAGRLRGPSALRGSGLRRGLDEHVVAALLDRALDARGRRHPLDGRRALRGATRP